MAIGSVAVLVVMFVFADVPCAGVGAETVLGKLCAVFARCLTFECVFSCVLLKFTMICRSEKN